jgi:phospholipase C
LVISAAALGTAAVLTLPAASRFAAANGGPPPGPATATPIQHLVVIFQENVSFDHYFGTYPNAANTSGQEFDAAHGTPAVNGLTPALLNHNPNGVNPQRLDPANINDVLTCDQNHDYGPEQQAFDGGKMDNFPGTVGTGSGTSPTGQKCNANDVMNYYDGNSVTGLWNYAQQFSMSDNSFGTTFGPSSPGAINLVSGDTGNVDTSHIVAPPNNDPLTNGDTISDGNGGVSLISDAQPFYDACSTRDAVAMSGTNVGDQLNAAGISWGWFQGGFRPTSTNPVQCAAKHPIGAAIGGTGQWGFKGDYIPHHEPFEYYASTANPQHLPPASLAAIGTDTQSYTNGKPNFDTANHQYDMSDFDALVGAISHGYLSPDHLPAVSFLKAPGYQDGHAGYSDPFDEQKFVISEINALQHTPDWSSTAVVIAYDDSDGWYDHAYSGVHNASNTSSVAVPPGPQDFLTGLGLCGNTVANPPLADQSGRCGYGPRLPLLVISPWARQNFVDHTLTDQSSVTRFIEDNWLHGNRIPGSFATIAGTLNSLFNFNANHGTNHKLYLDVVTGQPNDS